MRRLGGMAGLLCAAFLCWHSPAHALDTQVVAVCGTPTGLSYPVPGIGSVTVDTNGKLCINATVTASVTGFQGNGSFANLTATASSSASTALPTGTSTRITNASSTATVSCTMATGAATGLVSNIVIPPLSSVSRVNGSFDHIACIDQTGSTGSNLVVLEGGAGLGNDSGGGGGSSGGGLSVLDNSSWTNNSSNFTPNGGVFNDSATALSSGNQGTVRLNAHREMHVDCDTGNTLCAAIQAAIPAGTNLIGNVGQIYPAGSTPITASATGTTAATTATLAANASLHTYICGFSIRANATAAATGNATVTGTVTGTLNFTQWTAPLASGLGVTEEIFTPCVISSAINTGLAVISAAPGSGGVVSVTAWGYQL